jgi:hypothetical protein
VKGPRQAADGRNAGIADEVTDIDVDAVGELFAAMVFLAALAYPQSHPARNRFITAMKSACQRAARAAGRSTAAPVLLAKNQNATLRLGVKRIHYRVLAARAASCELPTIFFQRLLRGVEFVGPDAAKASLQLRAKNSRTRRIESITNDHSRAFRHWRATAPVLHLGLSLNSVPAAYGAGFQLLFNTGWIAAALRRAEVLAQVLRDDSFISGPQIRLRPAVPI